MQIIRGRPKDEASLHKQWDQWDKELKQGAKGYLGRTVGIAKDDSFIAVVAFDSDDAAQRNSDRPEQQQWWQETSKFFDGEATFYDLPSSLLRDWEKNRFRRGMFGGGRGTVRDWALWASLGALFGCLFLTPILESFGY
jgi:hypothetical protein